MLDLLLTTECGYGEAALIVQKINDGDNDGDDSDGQWSKRL